MATSVRATCCTRKPTSPRRSTCSAIDRATGWTRVLPRRCLGMSEQLPSDRPEFAHRCDLARPRSANAVARWSMLPSRNRRPGAKQPCPSLRDLQASLTSNTVRKEPTQSRDSPERFRACSVRQAESPPDVQERQCRGAECMDIHGERKTADAGRELGCRSSQFFSRLALTTSVRSQAKHRGLASSLPSATFASPTIAGACVGEHRLQQAVIVAGPCSIGLEVVFASARRREKRRRS
jgi:hypothetical protein